MKFMKYLFAFAVAIAFFATANVARAADAVGTAVYIGTGSSALFLELGQAAAALSDTGCYWTKKTAPSGTTIAARDTRVGSPGTDETGAIWIAWGKGSGSCATPAGSFNVYSQMNLDSVLGDRCFFMVDSGGVAGCTQIITVPGSVGGVGGTAGDSPSLLGSGYTDTIIPSGVVAALNNQRVFVAATDIRPEDAKFASARMFAACGAPISRNPYLFTSYQTTGLGYGTGTTGVGVDIVDIFAKHFHVLDFNITGNDPITAKALPSNVANYTVSTVGAQPILVVATYAASATTGIQAATDISFDTLAEFLMGAYGRSNDITGNTTTNGVTVYEREPLSGTYNTMEYSTVNSNEIKNSQELFNCSGSSVGPQPMNIPTAFGAIPNASKQRVIGTGNMITALKAHANGDSLGYFFWSAANGSGFDSTQSKYLTVAGVDPILDRYGSALYSGGTGCASGPSDLAPGQIPDSVNGGLPCVTFKNLNAGDYPIWSALRLVSISPTPAGVTNLIAGAQTLSSTQNDFIPLSRLKTWHAHFNFYGLGLLGLSNGNTVNPLTPGDLCSLAPLSSNPEAGGDAGGSNVSIIGNNHFCVDFSDGEGRDDHNN
jgi:hypothetical protein